MCGIGGWLGVLPDAAGGANRLVHALRHRGPDAHGSRWWPAATLVHTRLSIIDLSPTGAQPMANEDETVWTVFSGLQASKETLADRMHLAGRVPTPSALQPARTRIYTIHRSQYRAQLPAYRCHTNARFPG